MVDNGIIIIFIIITNYNYKVTVVLVDEIVDFKSLVASILEEIHLDVFISSIKLSELLDFGKNNTQTVFQINQENDVSWFNFLF